MSGAFGKFLGKFGSYSAAALAGFELHNSLLPSNLNHDQVIPKFEKAVIEAKKDVIDANKGLDVEIDEIKFLLFCAALIILFCVMFKICTEAIATIRSRATEKFQRSLQA